MREMTSARRLTPLRHGGARPPRLLRNGPGFTLVEVLVALLIMSIIAVMGWRGIDGMARARDTSQSAAERTLLLSALVGQWEQDLQALHETPSVPALSFDGASLRLTRRSEGGVRLVVWSLREGRWLRWTTAPMTRAGELQEAWMRSQQLQGSEPQQLELLAGVQDWQVYYYRGQGWSNAQSTGDLVEPPAAAAAAAGRPALLQQQQLPTGVRLVIELPEGRLTRDVRLGAS